MLSEIPDWFIVDNGIARFAVEKRSGKIKSARVHGVPLEVVSRYPRYSLFFPELEFVYPDGRREHYLPEFSGDVSTEVVYNGPDALLIDVHWRTEVVHISWEYCFLYDRPYFIVRTQREIRRRGVYANAQQCMMVGSEFDDGYIVSYDGTWIEALADRGPHTRVEHSMFSAIDAGQGVRYPAVAWHEDGTDITCGAFVTSVTPNQRETISYELNGLICLALCFGEAQWNFFGKSDNETIYLEQGTTYGMEMYYYLDRGGAEEFDALNRAIFNERAHEPRNSEEYTVASWGGWFSGDEWMRWWFPQASSNYIASQERDFPQSFGIPRTQYDRPSGLLRMTVKAGIGTTDIDLAPVGRDGPVHQDARTYIEDDRSTGEMSWEIWRFRHTLKYEVYPDSDKLVVGGEIELLSDRYLNTLYVDLWALPRVREMVSLDAGIYDVRADDPVYDTIGITVYDCSGFMEIRNTRTSFRMLLANHPQSRLHRRGDRWAYTFTLFPHLGYEVTSPSQITPLHTRPAPTYREHYRTLPETEGENSLGILPSKSAFVIRSELFPEPRVVAHLELFACRGDYPIRFFVDVPRIGAVLKDGAMLPITDWLFDERRRTLNVHASWEERRTSLTICAMPEVSRLLQNRPNPFNTETTIEYDVARLGIVHLSIYTSTGQRIRTLVDGEHPAGSYSVIWDGRDEAGRVVASGVYLCRMEADNYRAARKMLLVH